MLTRRSLEKARHFMDLSLEEMAATLGVPLRSYTAVEQALQPLPGAWLGEIERLINSHSSEDEEAYGLYNEYGFERLIREEDESYDDVVITFHSGAALTVPLNHQYRVALQEMFSSGEDVIDISTRDNRKIKIRVNAIADIYICDQDVHDGIPGDFGTIINTENDDEYWDLVEFILRIKDEAAGETLWDLVEVSSGDPDFGDVAESLAHAKSIFGYDRLRRVLGVCEMYGDLADRRTRCIEWRLSNGTMRAEYYVDHSDAYTWFEDHLCVDDHEIDIEGDWLYIGRLRTETSAYINFQNIDYLTVPKHAFNYGSIVQPG